jgi:intracellular sulfur oxidation DsrE/DsrF family protein
MHNVNTTRGSVWHCSNQVVVFTSAIAFLIDNHAKESANLPSLSSVQVSACSNSHARASLLNRLRLPGERPLHF